MRVDVYADAGHAHAQCVSKMLSVIFLCVRIFLCDCDLILLLYERWGKRPEVVLGRKVIKIMDYRGIQWDWGRYFTTELAMVGARLVLSARSKEDLRKVADKCRGEFCFRMPQKDSVNILQDQEDLKVYYKCCPEFPTVPKS